MSRPEPHPIWILLAGLAFALGLIWVEAILWHERESLGDAFWWAQAPLAFCAIAAAFLYRQMTASEAGATMKPVSAERADPEQVRRQLVEMAERIEQRERELSERLKTFHEWMEFPQPLDLADADPDAATRNSERDRQLFQLIEEESRRVFNKILAGDYSHDGRVKIEEIRDEALALVRRIARIYRPDPPDPLLETSVAQILHAASRASLQFITVLEELPLDVKEYSIQSIYDYVEKGVKAYGVYKRFEPYKPYVDTAYYLGRFAMGASPLTLGAWWLVGAIGREGAKALTTHVLEGQALAFLHNLIRVIAYEVAGIYSGDFRHRDPNWFYAIELVELLHLFPASRRSLRRGLNEIGRLSLRSEYDRIFLYRCLAAGQSARPDQYDATILSTAERGQIARRLEQIFVEDIHAPDPERVAQWKEGLEQRLNVRVKLDTAAVARRSEQESLQLAARSLASFLIDRRQREPTDLPKVLQSTRTFSAVDPAARKPFEERVVQDPPFFFEPPDLDPDSPVTRQYLEDLIHLAVEPPSSAPDDRQLINDVAHYLGQDAAAVLKQFDQALISRLSRNLSAFQPEGQFTPANAALVARRLDPGTPIRFVYSGISTEPPLPGELVLVGTDSDCRLLSSESELPLWISSTDTIASQQTTLGQGHCRITGGRWQDGRERVIKVDLPFLSGYARHFRALLEQLPSTSSEDR